ncbi:hypothetical protein PQX77_015576 [Marasmius sp. AFHP31]|nr:hypothetical protein PQX77_015576 [Marasmius sp. AFHP31]
MPGLDPSSYSVNSTHKTAGEINDDAILSARFRAFERRQQTPGPILGWSPPNSDGGARPLAAHSAQPSVALWPSQHQARSQQPKHNFSALRGRSPPNSDIDTGPSTGTKTERPRAQAVGQGLPRVVEERPLVACSVQPSTIPQSWQPSEEPQHFEKADNGFGAIRDWSPSGSDGQAGPSTNTRRAWDSTTSGTQRPSLVVEDEYARSSASHSAQKFTTQHTTFPHSSQPSTGHQYFETHHSSTTVRGWAPPESEGRAGPRNSTRTNAERPRAPEASTSGSQGYPAFVEEDFEGTSPFDTPPSQPRAGPEYFKKARNVTIGDYANFSSVQGNQYINITERVEEKKMKLAINGDEDEEAEYAQFSEVTRCDVMALKTIYQNEEWVYDEEKGENVKCETLVTSSEVTIKGKETKCTVIAFQGGKAAEKVIRESPRMPRPELNLHITAMEERLQTGVWDAVFALLPWFWKQADYSLLLFGSRRPELTPLQAINRTDIPMLIFPTELLPLSHFVDKLPKLAQMFVETWIIQMCCNYTEVWMDGSRGLLCRGPDGPDCNIGHYDLGVKDVPSETSLLKEDALIAYLAQLESSKEIDKEVVRGIGLTCMRQESEMAVDRPTMLFKASGSSTETLAVGRTSWKAAIGAGVGNRKMMGGGIARFTLDPEFRGHRLKLELDADVETDAWLAQSHRIFHERDVCLKDDLSAYKLVLPQEMRGKLSHSNGKYKNRALLPTVYLFTSLQSTRTFWSFDEAGQTVIPPRTCEFLGLPVDFAVKHWEYSHPTQTYEHMRAYQKGRGYDYTTAEFASYCGYAIYEVVGSSVNRFEEVDRTEPSTSGGLFGLSKLVRSKWSSFSTAVTVSDDVVISVFGF